MIPEIAGQPANLVERQATVTARARERTELLAGEIAGKSGDTVELSDAARSTEAAIAELGVREELVMRVRGELATGQYTIADKLDVVVERIHRALHG